MENGNKKRGRPPKTKDYNSSFAKRLREICEGRTQQEIADGAGITRQNLGKFLLGETKPDVDTLEKLATFFNVSTDYLLGRTDVKPIDPSLDAAVEYTGLSPNSIHNILYFAKRCKFRYEKNKKELQISQQVLNDILTTRSFWKIVENFSYLSILKDRGFDYEQEKKEAEERAKSLKAALESEIGHSVDIPINTTDVFLSVKYDTINNFEELIKKFLPEKEQVNINGEYYSPKE